MSLTDPKEILPTGAVFDKLGTQITEGCFVVYGTLLGRSAAMKVGQIKKIRQLENRYKPEESDWRFTVQGINEGWGTRPAVLGKLGTLQFADRLIVIERHMVPAGWLALFD